MFNVFARTFLTASRNDGWRKPDASQTVRK